MLKRKLTKAEFDALDEGQKALYKENSARAGEYILDVEPDTDNSALRQARDREKQRADQAEAKLAELTSSVEDLTAQLATAQQNKPDLEKLGKDYKAKEEKLKADLEKKIAEKDKQIAAILVDRTALELASKISTAPELVVDIIKRRLKVGTNDAGEPTTEVLDGAGLASNLSVEDLGKELVANPKYSAIMVGSNATGSGASQPKGGSGATYKGKKFNDLSEAERVAWYKEDPAGFNAAKEAIQTAKF